MEDNRLKRIALGGQLGKGKFALVDDQDYEVIAQKRWYLHATGYAVHSVGNRKIRMHHLILPKREGWNVDHINLNKIDNRRSNLRYANNSQNIANRARRRDNTSGLKGVDFAKNLGKWRARVWLDGSAFHIGYFTDPMEAGKAYDKRAKELLGPFAHLNFPEPSWRTTDS